MPPGIAPDDIVRTHEEGEGNERPPLLVLDPLVTFLDAAGLGTGEPRVTPIGDGHSNHTFLLDRGGTDMIVRRPPRPPLPPSAHDVLREARVIGALEGRARVPAVLAVCDDTSVIGCPFYVMERVAGEVVSDTLPAAFDADGTRQQMAEELVDALVELHAVDWRAAGLEGFGKPQGYLERQVRRFLGLWEHNKTREVEAVETVGAWLSDNLPASGAATIVHGDYRLGNAMFAPDAPARLVAIFDWEMATIGDPLADVGYLCALWTQAGDPSGGLREHLGKVTRQPGFLTREQLVARYEDGSGRSMDDMRWYMTLAIWKSIVFMEGNYKRATTGATDDPYLKSFGEGVVELAEQAEALALGSGEL